MQSGTVAENVASVAAHLSLRSGAAAFQPFVVDATATRAPGQQAAPVTRMPRDRKKAFWPSRNTGSQDWDWPLGVGVGRGGCPSQREVPGASLEGAEGSPTCFCTCSPPSEAGTESDLRGTDSLGVEETELASSFFFQNNAGVLRRHAGEGLGAHSRPACGPTSDLGRSSLFGTEQVLRKVSSVLGWNEWASPADFRGFSLKFEGEAEMCPRTNQLHRAPSDLNQMHRLWHEVQGVLPGTDLGHHHQNPRTEHACHPESSPGLSAPCPCRAPGPRQWMTCFLSLGVRLHFPEFLGMESDSVCS
ncbi:uncharacterized protein [Symphalangus syndactylus]|uniref:uncharacterized protein n=1 Tax=Symphalangus syndactylus TaxID=9590 RepID=UPI00300419B0